MALGSVRYLELSQTCWDLSLPLCLHFLTVLLCLLPSPRPSFLPACPELLQFQHSKEGITYGLLPCLPANSEKLKKADAEGDQGQEGVVLPLRKAPGAMSREDNRDVLRLQAGQRRWGGGLRGHMQVMERAKGLGC